MSKDSQAWCLQEMGTERHRPRHLLGLRELGSTEGLCRAATLDWGPSGQLPWGNGIH